MALSHRADTVIKNLAKRGDIDARQAINKATARDDLYTKSWAKRGLIKAIRNVKGSGSPVMVKAMMNRLARFGDYVAQGLNTLTTDKLAQVITFAQPAAQDLIDGGVDGILPETLNLVATSDSGLAVQFTVVSGPATVAGSALTMTAAGSVVVRATQAGDANHAAATPVQRTIIVTIVP
jgi:hypothetical protein